MASALQQQCSAVAEAASTMVQATTDSTTRTAASNFLDQWTRTTEAWVVYGEWLHSFGPSLHHDASHVSLQEHIGTQILCLTLLQTKIRREVPKGTPEFPALSRIRQELWSLLLACSGGANASGASSTVLGPLCVCTAALEARCGNLSGLVAMCCNVDMNANGGFVGKAPSQVVALKLLSTVPVEAEACSDLTTPQAELRPSIERVLIFIHHSLATPDAALGALEALCAWSQTCHATLSQLGGTSPNGESLLSALVRILSSPQPSSEKMIVMACRALTESILVPTDSCTPSRQEAAAQMLRAIPDMGFVGNPLQYATDQLWVDACHALSTCICTLVAEEIDDICTRPAEPVLALLLRLQSHPHVPVVLPVLECWLTVQGIPTSDRHGNWTKPIFRQVIRQLAMRIAYPIDGEVEDETEFGELRRMVADVFVSSYFLLRSEYIQHMSQLIVRSQQPQQSWNSVEAALFALQQVSREVCARMKASTGGASVRADREATGQELFQLVNHLIQTSPSKYAMIEKGVARLLGSYSQCWNLHCSSEHILELVSYLRGTCRDDIDSREETANAIRSIYVVCSMKLLEIPGEVLAKSIHDTMEGAIASVISGSGTTGSLIAVTEGSTRLLMQIQDVSLVQQAMLQMVSVLVPLGDQALHVVPSTDVAASNAAVEALVKYLCLLRTLIQYGDERWMGALVTTLWAFVDRVGHAAGSYEAVLEAWLAIHRQLLNSARGLAETGFSDTINMVVYALENTKHPSTLEYFASSVEAFCGTEESFFQALLSHVTSVVFAYVAKENSPDHCPQLIRAYMELIQRYLLFQPSPLVACRDFPGIVAFSVECLSACKGEPHSTRASLNFLAQLFGWRLLRLSVSSSAVLDDSAGRIDELLIQHGEVVVCACVKGLSGGSPQILWPSLSDCLFAIVAHVSSAAAAEPVVEDTTIAHTWIYSALMSIRGDGSLLTIETFQQIITILFRFARDGPKSKPKAKMLLSDFAKICTGDMNTDALLSYKLQ